VFHSPKINSYPGYPAAIGRSLYPVMACCFTPVIKYQMKSKTAIKKDRIRKRNNKLDPNNNKNPLEKPFVKLHQKTVHDDGFEHRSSDETI
jgi:hypothetical protein